MLRGTNYTFVQDAIIDQARVEGTTTCNPASVGHDLKFGAGFREQENHSGTVWPRGKTVVSGEYLELDPGIAQVIFPRNRRFAIESTYDSAWLQDAISTGRWTITAGLRYDQQELENLPSSDPGNDQALGLIPALSFEGNDAGGFSFESLVPRIGVSYALGEERRTILRGSYSRYAEQLGQLPLGSRVNPIGYSYAYFYFADANGNLVLDDAERGSLEFAYTYNIDPDNPTSLVTPNVNDPDLDPTMTDELTFGDRARLSSNNMAIGVTATWRNITDIPEQRVLIVDAERGDPDRHPRRLGVRRGHHRHPAQRPGGHGAGLRPQVGAQLDRRLLLHQRRPRAGVPRPDRQLPAAAGGRLELPRLRPLERLGLEDRRRVQAATTIPTTRSPTASASPIRRGHGGLPVERQQGRRVHRLGLVVRALRPLPGGAATGPGASTWRPASTAARVSWRRRRAATRPKTAGGGSSWRRSTSSGSTTWSRSTCVSRRS